MKYAYEKPNTEIEICKFIEVWSDWFYNTTDSFEGALGRSLAYLWPAIVKNNQIEVSSRSAIVQHLKRHSVSEENPIWTYIDIVG